MTSATSLPPRGPWPLFGREAELAQALAVLDGGERLLVVGPRGIGKTRLAQEIAAAWASDLPGERSVCWCALEGAVAPAEQLDRIAAALSATSGAAPGALGDDGSARGPASDARRVQARRVAATLADRGPCLLVLDGAEGGEGLSAFLDVLPAMAPEATVLVTTHAPVEVAGARVLELGGLAGAADAAAAAAATSGGITAGAAAAPVAPSVASMAALGPGGRLFAAAAARARPGWVATAEEASFVEAIVAELDGVPQAIELAAARMAIMGARALLHRMRQHAGGAIARDALSGSVAAAVAALLPHELATLRQLRVFRGELDATAAEAVVDLHAHPDAPAVLEVLGQLRARWLLSAREDAGGEVRLRLPHAVRRALGDAGVDVDLEERHAAWAMAAAAAAARTAPGAVLRHRDELLGVVERVLGRGPVTTRAAEPALRALVLLGPALLEGGPAAAYLELLGPVLDATKASGADPALAAEVLALRGALRRRRDDAIGGARDLVRALGLARTLGAAALEGRVTAELGLALAARGAISDAVVHLEAAVRSAQAHAPADEASALLGLGRVLRAAGRSAEAHTVVERALALVSIDAGAASSPLGAPPPSSAVARAGAPSPQARAASARVAPAPTTPEEAQRAMAVALLDLGRAAEARALLAHRGHLEAQPARALVLGLCDHDAGALESARAHYQEAGAGLRIAGLPADAAEVDTLLAALCRAEGRAAEAYALLRRAVVVLDEAGELERARRARLHLAGVEHRAGHLDEARHLLAGVRESLDAASVLQAEVAVVQAQLAGARLAEGAGTLPVTVRLMRRCLLGPQPASRALPPDDALVVGVGGAWFRPPRGERVSLATRKPLARVLERLVAARVSAPGKAMSWEELLAAGWPGERVLASAGAHRVRVALSSLRKLGLRESLHTSEAGYALAAEVVLVRDEG